MTYTSKSSPTETVRTGDLNYTLGGLLTILDGSLGISYGTTLSGTHGKPYYAVGISLLSATEKARELFKGMSK